MLESGVGQWVGSRHKEGEMTIIIVKEDIVYLSFLDVHISN